MKKLFAVRIQPQSVDLVLLFVRVVTGYAFMLHGWGKIQNPFGWMPDSAIPGILQALGALAEFGGGLALIIGLVSRLASLGLFFTMIVAAGMHAISFGHPFVNMTGGPSYEPAVVYLMISLFLTVMGPGKFSLDNKIFGKAP